MSDTQQYDKISPGARAQIVDSVRQLFHLLNKGVAGGLYGYDPDTSADIDGLATTIDSIIRQYGWYDTMFPANENIYFNREPGMALSPADGGKAIWEIVS